MPLLSFILPPSSRLSHFFPSLEARVIPVTELIASAADAEHLSPHAPAPTTKMPRPAIAAAAGAAGRSATTGDIWYFLMPRVDYKTSHCLLGALSPKR